MTDHARDAAEMIADEARLSRTGKHGEHFYRLIQQAIDAATAELDEAATETLAEVMQERDFKDAEIERLMAYEEARATEDAARIAALERVVEAARTVNLTKQSRDGIMRDGPEDCFSTGLVLIHEALAALDKGTT